MDNTVTQFRQPDRISYGESNFHAVVNQSSVKAPAIKSLPDIHLESRKQRDHEIGLLLTMANDRVLPNREALNGFVLKVRSGEVISEKQAICAGFRVVQRGQPDHGVILHYGQLHSVEIPGLIASDGAPYAMGEGLKSKIKHCQRKIFDELLTSGIQHVFVEGYEQTLVPDEFMAGTTNAHFRDKIRARFHGYRPGDALPPEMENLFYAGGDQIYGHLVTGVSLHSTITPDQVARHDAYYSDQHSRARFIDNKFSAPQQDRAIFFDQVEQILIAKMKAVMLRKPLNVVLAFGRDHAIESLAAYCKEQGFSPAIYSKDATA